MFSFILLLSIWIVYMVVLRKCLKSPLMPISCVIFGHKRLDYIDDHYAGHKKGWLCTRCPYEEAEIIKE